VIRMNEDGKEREGKKERKNNLEMIDERKHKG